MKKRLVGVLILIIGIIFTCYAISHPEASFPFSNFVTYMIYFAYLVIMIFLLVKPVKKR